MEKGSKNEEESKTGEVSILNVAVLIFLVLMCLDLYFFDIFSWKLDFHKSISAFESPHLDEYKNDYDFSKLAALLEPLFQ